MKVRAKFTVNAVGPGGKTVKLNAVTDKTGIPEDEHFARYTPAGTMQMWVDNPALEGKFKVGQTFYVTLEEAPE